MRKTEERVETFVRETEVVCNVCGKSCGTDWVTTEYANITVSWGFASKKEGCRESSDICEDCYDTLVASFKIPPTNLKQDDY